MNYLQLCYKQDSQKTSFTYCKSNSSRNCLETTIATINYLTYVSNMHLSKTIVTNSLHIVKEHQKT